jgi:CrcB protein
MSKNFNIRVPLAIGLGAIAGALCRYYFGWWLTQSFDTGFPTGTLVVNLSGCFFMGLITTLATDRLLFNPDLILLLTTGFLGAYTTFSAYELDAANLLEEKSLQGDLAYWIGSPLLGFLCFNLGVKLTKLTKS